MLPRHDRGALPHRAMADAANTVRTWATVTVPALSARAGVKAVLSVLLREIKASIVLASVVLSPVPSATPPDTTRYPLCENPEDQPDGRGLGCGGLCGFRDLDRCVQIVDKMLAGSRSAQANLSLIKIDLYWPQAV